MVYKKQICLTLNYSLLEQRCDNRYARITPAGGGGCAYAATVY